MHVKNHGRTFVEEKVNSESIIKDILEAQKLIYGEENRYKRDNFIGGFQCQPEIIKWKCNNPEYNVSGINIKILGKKKNTKKKRKKFIKKLQKNRIKMKSIFYTARLSRDKSFYDSMWPVGSRILKTSITNIDLSS
jgi:hypothetical protein